MSNSKIELIKMIINEIREVDNELGEYLSKNNLHENFFIYDSTRISSQFSFCPMAVSGDVYNQCAFNCSYCFSYRGKQNMSNHNKDINTINFENLSVVDIANIAIIMYIAVKKPTLMDEYSYGVKKSGLYNIFHNKYPFHLGGLTDPFSPVENHIKATLMLLKICNMLKYPLVISTKSSWINKEDKINYHKAIIENKDNILFQVSLCSTDPVLDKIESGTSVSGRLDFIQWLLDNDINVAIRCQPFIPIITNGKYFQDYINKISDLKGKNGKRIAGVTVEFLKLSISLTPAQKNDFFNIFYKNGIDIRSLFDKEGTTEGTDKVLSIRYRYEYFMEIKKKFNDRGILVYSAENKLRIFGDGANCCGISENMELSKYVSKRNFNYLVFEMIKNPNKRYYYKDFIALDTNNTVGETNIVFYSQLKKLAKSKGLNIKNTNFSDIIKIYWDGSYGNSPDKFFLGIEKTMDFDGESMYRYNPDLLNRQIGEEDEYS